MVPRLVAAPQRRVCRGSCRLRARKGSAEDAGGKGRLGMGCRLSGMHPGEPQGKGRCHCGREWFGTSGMVGGWSEDSSFLAVRSGNGKSVVTSLWPCSALVTNGLPRFRKQLLKRELMKNRC